MKVDKQSVDKLMRASYNPRKELKPGDKEYELLKKSIKEFGYVEPIIVNDKTGNIVGGHQRLAVLKDLGYTDVEVVHVELDDAREKALNIALNKISGSWDADKLEDLLRDIKENSDLDIELTGFDLGELETLFNGSLEDCGVADGDFDTDEKLDKLCEESNEILNNIRNIQLGDMYKLGKHVLLCGDSYVKSTYTKLIGSNNIDMVFTDPPYNYEKMNKRSKDSMFKGRTYNKERMLEAKDIGIYEFNIKNIEYLFGIGLLNLYLCCNRYDLIHYLNMAVKYKYNYDVHVLLKRNCMTMHRDGYLNDIEYLVFLRNKGAIFNGELKHDFYRHLYKDYTDDEALEKQVYSHVTFTRSQEGISESDIELEHPTVKPLRFVIPKILISSNIDGIVVDMFGGSGTTLIACEKLDRRCFMVEFMPKYCNEIINRWEALTGLKAEKVI